MHIIFNLLGEGTWAPNLKKIENEISALVKPWEEKVREIKGEDSSSEIEEFPVEEVEIEERVEKKKKAKKEVKVERPLPFEVKEQMILYIEYNDMQLNKKLLVEHILVKEKNYN